MKYLSLISALCLLFCSACSTREVPIVDGWKQNSAESSDYRVQKDDTIYYIAWEFGMDYHELARLNNLQAPYQLTEGQTLRMSSAAHTPLNLTDKLTAAANVNAPTEEIVEPAQAIPADAAPTFTPASQETPPTTPTPKPQTWLWPTQGKLVSHFSSAPGGNKGINISGRLAQPVTATATGKVVYTGASLPGYGNLIIVKHSDNELSAYAFNQVILVKEGQVVQAGQTIARMGKNESGKAMLHFEIRKSGKPIDPMPYLKAKNR